jgi:sulfoxide reductase heme-binding subunit YedZ
MLHRLVYVSAVAGVLHFWWLVKLDVRRPAFYGLIVAVLLMFRVFWARLHAVPQRAGPRRPSVPELGGIDHQRR